MFILHKSQTIQMTSVCIFFLYSLWLCCSCSSNCYCHIWNRYNDICAHQCKHYEIFADLVKNGNDVERNKKRKLRRVEKTEAKKIEWRSFSYATMIIELVVEWIHFSTLNQEIFIRLNKQEFLIYLFFNVYQTFSNICLAIIYLTVQFQHQINLKLKFGFELFVWPLFFPRNIIRWTNSYCAEIDEIRLSSSKW